MRVIMTGGGTGGHIYPAIAIADKIKEKAHHCEILFIGTERGLESKLVPDSGYDISYITVRGMNRKNLIKNIKVFADYQRAKKQAEKIIKEFKPDLVIGTGGYVSGPVVKMAASLDIPCYIQEQNAIPGLSNRMLEKYANNVFLGFEEAGQYFKYPEKHLVTGNPVRADFNIGKKTEIKKLLGIGENEFTILAFGGSGGAGRLNKAMVEVIKKYNNDSKVQVIFSPGRAYYLPMLTEMKEMGIELGENIKMMEYIENMAQYLNAADLVVARSGALTVSEIALCEKPSILIPSPNVTGDHQTFNARAISDKGGAVLLREDKLSRGVLLEEIDRLRSNPALLKGMAEQAARCAPVDAADIIYYSILE